MHSVFCFPVAKDGLFSLDCDEYNLCGELKDFVDKGEAEWVGPSTAYALLSNAEIFWVDIKDVVRFHGGCAIVKTELYASEISQQAGYFEDVAVIATEKRMRKLSGKVIAKSEVPLYTSHELVDLQANIIIIYS